MDEELIKEQEEWSLLRKEQLEFYKNSDDRNCPVCFTRCEIKGYHERDSTYDKHFCPQCGWDCIEMELWD